MVDLKQLESKRLQLYDAYKKDNKIAVILFVVAAVFGIITFLSTIIPLLIVSIVSVLVAAFYSNKASKYANSFRNTVKNEVVMFVLNSQFENVYYNHNQTISLQTIMSAGLVKSPDRFFGEDYIRASYKGVDFEVSDVDLKERVVTRDARGNTVVTYETYFKGRWYVYRFKRTFKDSLKISEGNSSYVNTRGMEKFETESIQFNKKFRIHTTSKEHGFYLVTPSVLEKLLKLESMHRGTIMYCFQKNELHIGVNDRKNYLEVSFKTPINEESINTFASDVDLIAAIVNELRLDGAKFNSLER